MSQQDLQTAQTSRFQLHPITVHRTKEPQPPKASKKRQKKLPMPFQKANYITPKLKKKKSMRRARFELASPAHYRLGSRLVNHLSNDVSHMPKRTWESLEVFTYYQNGAFEHS
jgi:hypothetical protein